MLKIATRFGSSLCGKPCLVSNEIITVFGSTISINIFSLMKENKLYIFHETLLYID